VGGVCDARALETSLEGTLNEALELYRGNPGWLMGASAPPLGLDFRGAHGGAPETNAPLDPDAPFRIASITKTFVAAATLRLVEDKKLSLDDTVADVVPAPYPEILAEGGYMPEWITVRHLLTHTSGLYDYATDDEFIAAVMAAPSRKWTREEQVAFAMEHGEPIGRPDAQFVYSDTGYLLLGAMLESKTGLNVGKALRSLLDYSAIGLKSTWMEELEPPPPEAKPLLPQYVDDLAMTEIDPTMDLWGGGGLISTTTELQQFYRALFTGKVFRSPSTLETLTTIPEVSQKAGGAMGIFRAPIGSLVCWAHQGAWGVGVAYCPVDDLGVAVADIETLTGSAGIRPLVEKTVSILGGCDDPGP
jgi:D-alanyl-D-alanine carboxypeptidase